MLEILRRIVQEITNAPNFTEALQTLVERVRTAIATQACTVFLVDKNKQEYILLATDGLNPAIIGKVRLKFGEGLVGLVGEREEPINLENAPAHPKFFHAPEVGEERFKAFLGVPIIHHRHLLGVIMVQQEQRRCFDEAEEAFLVTIAAQLGGVIAHAAATGAIERLLARTQLEKTQRDIIFSGFSGAPGISLGTAVLVYPLANLDAVPDRRARNISSECAALKKALALTRQEIHKLRQQLTHLPAEEKLLFEAYLRLLDSDNLEQEIIIEIQLGHWAQAALRRVINRRVKQFNAMDNDYLRERAADIRDLGRRVLLHLQKGQRPVPNYPAHTILLGEEITATTLAEVPAGKLAGVISMQGSSNSHVAIMARALGVPIVIGVENLCIQQLEGQEFIVDGYQGHVYVAPSAKVRRNFVQLINQQREFVESLEELSHLPAQTLDCCIVGQYWFNCGCYFIDYGRRRRHWFISH
jgi:phosphotransferase system, enzyme I, PtsP